MGLIRLGLIIYTGAVRKFIKLQFLFDRAFKSREPCSIKRPQKPWNSCLSGSFHEDSQPRFLKALLFPREMETKEPSMAGSWMISSLFKVPELGNALGPQEAIVFPTVRVAPACSPGRASGHWFCAQSGSLYLIKWELSPGIASQMHNPIILPVKRRTVSHWKYDNYTPMKSQKNRVRVSEFWGVSGNQTKMFFMLGCELS